VQDPIIASELPSACLGLSWLGTCRYNPAAPTSIYFSLGELVGALAFTLAVQQLLKPIYRFRLSVRYLSLSHLYICVFAGAGSVLIAALVPNFPILHSGPWGHAIVWEIGAAALFVVPYGAVALAIVRPVRVRKRRIGDFARGAATLLSAANETDHVDLLPDLQRSLPVLIEAAGFVEHPGPTSAFFDFIHRDEIKQASYAHSLLRIIADPPFCQTLVTRAPWRVVTILREISEKRLHARGAEQFIRELAHQAILRDDAMMAREVGYHGFGTAPLLSDSLFSDPFILRYDPLDSFHVASGDVVTAALLKRFNSAAERSYLALIEERHIYHAQVAFSIASFYRTVFMRAWEIQRTGERDFQLTFQMHDAVRNAIKLADKLLASLLQRSYDALFVANVEQHRSDVLETLVEIVYEALESIANEFKGFDDAFWHLAIDVFHKAFGSVARQPDGITPFQQRLALKIIDKLEDNMKGYYPAISRVLLSCVGPYQTSAPQPNRTAFNILKDAVYSELQRFPQLARVKPDQIADYLPDHVTYDTATSRLTHTYRSGTPPTITDLSALNLGAVSLIDPAIRRLLTDEERRNATEAI
jgi:hypothetical protein